MRNRRSTLTDMSSPGSPLARAVRAALVSLWSCLGAALAHVAGNGEPPPAIALVPVMALGAALAWCTSGRRWGFAAVFGLLALPQIGVHVLAGYVHGHQTMPSGQMALAHVVGLVVVAAAIAQVERRWWSWWDRLMCVVRPVHLARGPIAIPAPMGEGACVPRGAVLTHVLVRRGPPGY